MPVAFLSDAWFALVERERRRLLYEPTEEIRAVALTIRVTGRDESVIHVANGALRPNAHGDRGVSELSLGYDLAVKIVRGDADLVDLLVREDIGFSGMIRELGAVAALVDAPVRELADAIVSQTDF